MKETIAPTAKQTKRLDDCQPVESTSDQSVLMRTVLWIWRLLLLGRADPLVHCQVARGKRPRWPLVNIVLCLCLVGPILAAPFIVSQTTWATPESVAAHLTPQRPASTMYADATGTCPPAGSHTPTQNGTICTYTLNQGEKCASGYESTGGHSLDCTGSVTGLICPPAGSHSTPTPDITGTCSYTLSSGETTCANGYTRSGGHSLDCTTSAFLPASTGSSSTSNSAGGSNTPPQCPPTGNGETATMSYGICTYTITTAGEPCANGYVSTGGHSDECTTSGFTGKSTSSTAPGGSCPAVPSGYTATIDPNGVCIYTESSADASSACAPNYTKLGPQCSAPATTCLPNENSQLCDLLTPSDCPSSAPSYTSGTECALATSDVIGGGSCSGQYIPALFCNIGELIRSVFDIVKAGFQILGVLLRYDLPGWIACVLSAGTIPCPNETGAPWTFDCPTAYIVNGEIQIDAGENQTIYGAAVAGSTASSTGWTASSAKTVAQADWLSGDADINDTTASSLASEPGHLSMTYGADTIFRPRLQELFSFSLGLSMLLIGPLFVLAGFQILLASVKIGSEKAIANAMETLGRVLLAAATVGLSYYMITILLNLLNTANEAVLQLHAELGYPQTSINGVAGVSFAYPNDTQESFRGLVMPMTFWGCVLDDFIGLMASRIANIIGSGIPIVGGILGLTGRLTEIRDLIDDMGEFVLLVESVTIWGQAIARLVLINYYIFLAPMALACWGLPGQVGIQTVKAWFKGFMQLLFVQTLQIFILTTMPTFLPDFGLMHFPSGGSMINYPIQHLLVQLPPIITGFAAIGAPKVMMGMGPMQTVAKAGAMAGKVVGGAMIGIAGMVKRK